VKFVFFHKYRIMPTWDTRSGDLQCLGIMIEVKAFSSMGPTTFDPNKKWDLIYFVDATLFNEYRFKVYECKLKNTSEAWQQLKVNKDQTYGDQCKQGRRPRINFSDMLKQLGGYCHLIFDGEFSKNEIKRVAR
jgi:hypothetical protein